MKISPVGQEVLFVGLGLGILGVVFANVLTMLIFGASMFLIVIEVLTFRFEVKRFVSSLKIRSSPRLIETVVPATITFEVSLNMPRRPRLNIEEITYVFPNGVKGIQTLPRGNVADKEIKFRVPLKVDSPGILMSKRTMVNLRSRFRLFTQQTLLRDRVVVIASSSISGRVAPLETGILYDLAEDRLRRGTGTDLAGIRPYVYTDNMHRVDWKATARIGKLMTKEYFLEAEPKVIMVIDCSSSMKRRVGGKSTFDQLIDSMVDLDAVFPPSTALGAFLFDEQSVLSIVEPRMFMQSRNQIKLAMISAATISTRSGNLPRLGPRSYAQTENERRSMKRDLRSKGTSKLSVIGAFANKVLPYYEKAQAKYNSKIRKHGPFKAFEMVAILTDPSLVIVISGGRSEANALSEGIKTAIGRQHKVILALLNEAENSPTSEMLEALQQFGVGLLRCAPENLWKELGIKLVEASRQRIRLIEA